MQAHFLLTGPADPAFSHAHRVMGGEIVPSVVIPATRSDSARPEGFIITKSYIFHGSMMGAKKNKAKKAPFPGITLYAIAHNVVLPNLGLGGVAQRESGEMFRYRSRACVLPSHRGKTDGRV